jgi:phosphonate transport system substrate-binding protein
VRRLRVATYLAPCNRPAYQHISDEIARNLGVQCELVDGTAYRAIADGTIDVAFVCGLPYVRLAAQRSVDLVGAPVIIGARYERSPIYFSDVVVRRASQYQTFDDLRGCTWAYNEPNSHSGHLITLFNLLQRGETPVFFGRVVRAGSHERAIEMLCAGEVDAAAIDSHVLEVVTSRQPDLLEQLRVIDTWGPSTIQPAVVRSSLEPDLKQSISLVVQSIDGGDEHLRQCHIERYVEVADTTYNDIRAMLSAVEEAGITELA